jgi:hypothetical protein
LLEAADSVPGLAALKLRGLKAQEAALRDAEAAELPAALLALVLQVPLESRAVKAQLAPQFEEARWESGRLERQMALPPVVLLA